MLPGYFVVAESSLDDTKGVFDDMSSADTESEAKILRFASDPWISSSSRERKSSRVKQFYEMFSREYSNSQKDTVIDDSRRQLKGSDKFKVLWIVTHIPGSTHERDENVAKMKTHSQSSSSTRV